MLFLVLVISILPFLGFRSVYFFRQQLVFGKARKLISENKAAEAVAMYEETLTRYGISRSGAREYLTAKLALAEAVHINSSWHDLLIASGNMKLSGYISPALADFYHAKSLYHLTGTDEIKTISLLNKSLSSSGKENYSEITKLLINAYNRVGNYDRALLHLSNIIHIEPDDPYLQYQKGELLLNKGERQSARIILNDLIHAYPYSIYVQKAARMLLGILAKYNLSEESLYVLTYMFEKSNADPFFAAEYSHSLYCNGQKKKARSVLKISIDSNPDSKELKKLLAKYN